MSYRLCRLGAVLIPLMALGCQQPIKWSVQPRVEPHPLKPGKKFTVLCTVTGDLEQVAWVSAIPLAAPEAVLELKDDGMEGDAKAADGLFTFTRDLPDSVDAGEYEIEFVVYDKNDEPLQVHSFTVLDRDGKKVVKEVKPEGKAGEEAKVVELSAIITVTIE